MKDYDPERRQFLLVLMSLPMAVVIGCEAEVPKSKVLPPPLSPEDSLKKLILFLGPWTAADKEEAEDFARRFLRSKHNVGAYLPKSSKLIQNLASRFPKQTIAAKEIDLRKLPSKEKGLLLKLVRQLYSFVDVRFYVSNQSPWGDCLGDGTWHTRAPK